MRQAEFRANRLFMLASGMLVVISIGAFLWLAGLLEWRGSSGSWKIEITLECGNPAPQDIEAITFVDLEASSVEVDFVSDKESLRRHCPSTRISSTRKPSELVSAGKLDAPGDDRSIAAVFPTGCGGEKNSSNGCQTVVPTVNRLRLDFPSGKLLHFTGLAGRDLDARVDVSLSQRGSFSTTLKYKTLQVRPPENFYLASSRPSATLDPNDISSIDISKYDQPIAIAFSNERLSRLDHILDASVSAVLGVGVGGLMSAWLALRIARTKKAEKR